MKPEPPARTVKPRKRTYKRLPVVAIGHGAMLSEDGQLESLDRLPELLPDMPPTLFAKMAAADFLAGQLDPVFRETHPASWQRRTTVGERDIVHPNGTRLATRVTVIVHYFGFRGGNYHKIIDPVVMYGRKLDEIWPGDEPRIIKLLNWAVTLRDFCYEQGIEVRPTTGGISAQFLTDRRFYPNDRRKVPAATNRNARERLPGNYYHLNVHPTPRREYGAWYLDQHRAHHYHARTVRLPDANSLYAYGYFTDLRDIAFEDTIRDFHGLYCLDLQIPDRPLWIRDGERAFVWSNELDHLTDMGYVVNGVYAAWGSRSRDTGLSKYAAWASGQLDLYCDAPWIKPLLLSAYGVLAAKPKEAEAVFRLAKKGKPVTVVTGHNALDGIAVRSQRKLEPRIANVLHRGIIEAATRSESVGLAQWLDHLGFRILSIYADGVIVENQGDKNLPDIPEPWRLKTDLNHLRFINQQAFISGEMTKLPGVGKELRKYRQNGPPGHAPRKVMYDALTGQATTSNRRI